MELIVFDISHQVIHETLGDETLIVRLDSGNYYSMNITGGQIWNFIEQGASDIQIVAKFAELYGIDKKIVEEQTEPFLKNLIEEELIFPNGKKPNASAAYQSINIEILTNSFEPPILSKYSDVQELLILDPIHDVSDAGWPNSKSKIDGNG